VKENKKKLILFISLYIRDLYSFRFDTSFFTKLKMEKDFKMIFLKVPLLRLTKTKMRKNK